MTFWWTLTTDQKLGQSGRSTRFIGHDRKCLSVSWRWQPVDSLFLCFNITVAGLNHWLTWCCATHCLPSVQCRHKPEWGCPSRAGICSQFSDDLFLISSKFLSEGPFLYLTFSRCDPIYQAFDCHMGPFHLMTRASCDGAILSPWAPPSREVRGWCAPTLDLFCDFGTVLVCVRD